MPWIMEQQSVCTCLKSLKDSPSSRENYKLDAVNRLLRVGAIMRHCPLNWRRARCVNATLPVKELTRITFGHSMYYTSVYNIYIYSYLYTDKVAHKHTHVTG